RKRVKDYKKKRTTLSLIIISIPFFVYAFERTLYEWECSKNVYFYPDEKITLPKSLVYFSYIPKGRATYKEIDGEYRLNLFHDFNVQYIISIDDIDNPKLINENQLFKVLSGGRFLSEIMREVSDEEKAAAIHNARYAVYDDRSFMHNMVYINKYIYDFKSNSVISQVSLINHSKGQNLINILYPYEFGRCSKSKSEYSILEELLSNTFK
ncbi:hypothetical protein, partial [Pleionea mediterranea]